MQGVTLEKIFYDENYRKKMKKNSNAKTIVAQQKSINIL